MLVDWVETDFFRYRGEDSSLEMSAAVAADGYVVREAARTWDGTNPIHEVG